MAATLGVALLVWPVASALLLTIRWAGRGLLHRLHSREHLVTSHLRPALLLTAAAALTSAAAAYLATTSAPWWAILVVPFAVALGWCAACEWTRHRAVLAAHEAACRAAEVHLQRGPLADLYTACCSAGFVSRGRAHDTTCPTRTRSHTA
ncbi:hypothetical protein ACFWFB_32675 [Streptomyces albidoflavus]